MTPSSERLRVAVAVRHRLLREGIQRLVADDGFEVVGAADPAEALRHLLAWAPDILLLGVGDSPAAALATLQDLLLAAPSLKVLLAPEDSLAPSVRVALLAGARGVLAPDAPPDVLLRAIAAVGHGEYWAERRKLDASHGFGEVSRRDEPPRPAQTLTRRERQVVSAVVAGDSNLEIATLLRISESSVKHHVSAVYDKLGVSSRAELAAFAVLHGLTGSPRDPGRAA
jgi:DNA-binding NarL/FixJ family response regulator